MKILVLNPGGNSLKAEIVFCDPSHRYAFEGKTLVSITIEGIGKEAELSQMDDKKAVSSEKVSAADYSDATEALVAWCDKHGEGAEWRLGELDAIGIRVVHGGREFVKPARIDEKVEEGIVALERLAPLHNKSSVEVLPPLRKRLPELPIYAVFDSAFHRSIPLYASTYAIPPELAEKHEIQRYGFHGISHRYLLERYAHLAGKEPSQCSIVTMHLESGCSVTAIRDGKSVDNTMGVTPLEGVMMGTRSGDIDPAIVELLMREEKMSIDDVMTLLNKKSGLLGVSGVSLDTRVLIKQYDSNDRVKLALDIFGYRVRKAVGAYLAALGSAEAVVFGGGIAENSKLIRKMVCDGLGMFGLEMDTDANERLIDIEGPLSTTGSRLQAWVIPTEESRQIAHECCDAMQTHAN
jgi:acetate kinase